jgi:hypothetical protein
LAENQSSLIFARKLTGFGSASPLRGLAAKIQRQDFS